MTTIAPDVATGIIQAMYRAFNDRDIDTAVSHLGPGVDWPDAMTGGRISGRAAVRDYWLRQWSESDPRVEPLRIDMADDGTVHVLVDQLVRARDGTILENRQVEHVFQFQGPFISRMTIVEVPEAADDDDDDDDEDDTP